MNFTEIGVFHGRRPISQKNVMAVKSWIKLVPTYHVAVLKATIWTLPRLYVYTSVLHGPLTRKQNKKSLANANRNAQQRRKFESPVEQSLSQ